MPVHLKNKGFINFFIVLGFLFLIVVGSGAVYLFKARNMPVSQSPAARPLSQITPQPLRELLPTKSVSSKKIKYVLERKLESSAEEIFDIFNIAYLDILRWKNLLIFSDGGQNDNKYPPQIEIKVHNIDTGETDIIFDSNVYKDQFDPTKNPPDHLSDLMVIDDTLYFSLGGYLLDGAVFWLDLPPSGKPKKLISIKNGSVTKLRDWYFVIGGEGDSCWSERDFYLLDPGTKSAKKVISSKSGCNYGEEYLGLTKDGKVIMAYHGSLGDDPSQGDYEYVTTVDIFNPNSKNTIVGKEQMPSKINGMLYSEDRDQLLMIGSEIYLYNFTGGVLNKIVNVPKGVKLYFIENNWVQDKVCLDGEKGSTYNKYELDLSLKKITQPGLTCNTVSSPAPEKKDFEKLEQVINLLNLPLNYQLIEK